MRACQIERASGVARRAVLRRRVRRPPTRPGFGPSAQRIPLHPFGDLFEPHPLHPMQPMNGERGVLPGRWFCHEAPDGLVVPGGAHPEMLSDGGVLGARVQPPRPLEIEDATVPRRQPGLERFGSGATGRWLVTARPVMVIAALLTHPISVSGGCDNFGDLSPSPDKGRGTDRTASLPKQEKDGLTPRLSFIRRSPRARRSRRWDSNPRPADSKQARP